MTEIKGRDAIKIREIASKFNRVFSECFKDAPMRASIRPELGNDNIVLIDVLAFDIEGNFTAYKCQYQVDIEEFFFDRKMSKAFINSKYQRMAENSLLEFINEITSIRLAINTVRIDLNVIQSYTVTIGKSDVEEGCVDVHIKTYSDTAKDYYGFADAKKLVGADLATF